MSVSAGREEEDGEEGRGTPQIEERRRLHSCASTIWEGVQGVGLALEGSEESPPVVEVEKEVIECEEGEDGPFEEAAEAAASEEEIP